MKKAKWISTVCLAASAGASGVSLYLNGSYWLGAGQQDEARLAFAGASICADAIRWVLLPAAAIAAARKLRVAAATAIGMWCVLTLFCLFSGWSYAMQHMTLAVSDVRAVAIRIEDAQTAIAPIRQQLAALPAHRPAEMVAIDLATVKAEPGFRLSRECTIIRAGLENDVCVRFRRLQTESVAATKALALSEDLAAKLKELRELEGLRDRASASNPGRFLQQLLGWSDEAIHALLNAAIILVLEIVSGGGAYLALRLRMDEQEESELPDWPRPTGHWRPLGRQARTGTAQPNSTKRSVKSLARGPKGDEEDSQT